MCFFVCVRACSCAHIIVCPGEMGNTKTPDIYLQEIAQKDLSLTSPGPFRNVYAMLSDFSHASIHTSISHASLPRLQNLCFSAANCHRSSSPGPSQSPHMMLSSSSGRPGSVASMPDPGPSRAISLDSIATVSIPASLSHSVLASNVRSLVFLCHFTHIVSHCNML